MIIGIDAGALAESNKDFQVGVFRVTYEFIKSLTHLHKQHTYRLYSYAPIAPNILKEFGKSIIPLPLLPSFGYMKYRLPIELSIHPVDVFIGVAQAVPKTNTKTIGFVYDIGFLHYPFLYPNSNRLLKQTTHLIQNASHVVTISKTSRNDIMDFYHIPSANISVCYPGVSNIFRSKSIVKPHEVPYFLSVGILKKGKQTSLLIEAFQIFLSLTKDPYDLVLVGGDGGERENIQALISRMHLEKRVHLVGYQSDQNLVSWYKNATAFLAFSPTEGFCLPAAEAMACGCPVVYRKFGVLSEIVAAAGIGVESDKPEVIAQAMVRIRSNKLKAVCIKRSQLFDWNTFTKGIYDILNTI